jgi:hypothetical protein
MTAEFSTPSGNQSTLTLRASSAVAAGTYAATVVASAGGWSQSAALSVQVVPAAGGCASGGVTGLGPALVVAFLLLAGRPRRAEVRRRSRAPRSTAAG